MQIRSTQRHDFRHDTSDPIVEKRAQRVHRSQTGNNLHAGETGDNLQEEIPAIAAPPQPIMAAVPPADPAPPAPTFALGLDGTGLVDPHRYQVVLQGNCSA